MATQIRLGDWKRAVRTGDLGSAILALQDIQILITDRNIKRASSYIAY